MARTKEYKSANDFRVAVEDRIKKISKEEKIEIQKLRRQLSFDRLLARIFHSRTTPWVLKGGFAMQLRMRNSRTTKDIDLALKESRLKSSNSKEQSQALKDLLQEHARIDLKDFFVFTIGEPVMDLENAPYGGSRFPVDASLGDRSFEKFSLDVGVGDVWIEPLEELSSRPWLEFAGISSVSFPAISKEQQFAEKIHAYTLPRPEGTTNSRVKDLVDMVLLIGTESIDQERLASAIQATFKRRETHQFNSQLNAPPDQWKLRFEELASECSISTDVTSAFQLVQKFILELKL